MGTISISSDGEHCPWLGQDKQVEVIVGIKWAGFVPVTCDKSSLWEKGRSLGLRPKKGFY